MKYSKYRIHYSFLFCFVKEVSNNENTNSKLNTITPTSNVNINKAEEIEQGRNQPVKKASKSTNLGWSQNYNLKKHKSLWKSAETYYNFKVLTNLIKGIFTQWLTNLDSAKSAPNSQTENQRNTLTAINNLHRVNYHLYHKNLSWHEKISLQIYR